MARRSSLFRTATILLGISLSLSTFLAFWIFSQVPQQSFDSSVYQSLLLYLQSASKHLSLNDGVLQTGNKKARFQTNVFCRGCFSRLANEKDPNVERCGFYIQKEIEKLTATTNRQQDFDVRVEAGRAVSLEFPNTCGKKCLPESCLDSDKIFWRYDAILPSMISSSKIFTTIPSIPKEHILPEIAYSSNPTNLSDFFSIPEHRYPAAEYMMIYNPSIVLLPKKQQQQLEGENSSSRKFVYISSFRVSNQHYCFHPSDRKLMAGNTAGEGKVPNSAQQQQQEAKNWLGLALLDSTLTILDTVVVDPKQAGFPAAEDYRIFNLDDQIYLSSYDQITPLWLKYNNQNGVGMSMDMQLLVPNVYHNEPETTELQIYVRKYPSCVTCGKRKGFCGKNFNYFTTTKSSESLKILDEHSFVEIWPSRPHNVRAIELHQHQHYYQQEEGFCNRKHDSPVFVDDSSRALESSFATLEEIYFPTLKRWEQLFTRGRGSACCIRMKLSRKNNNKNVFVGVQHVKTPSQRNKMLPQGNITENHYLSQFYAFEVDPPFRLVGLSGLFCFGFPEQNELDEHPFIRTTTWRKLVIGVDFDCPRVHFVSGITRKANDSESVIIAYGVNDCFSRMVEMKLADIETMLFNSQEGFLRVNNSFKD